MSPGGRRDGSPNTDQVDSREEPTVLMTIGSDSTVVESSAEDGPAETTIVESSSKPASVLQSMLLERIEPSLARGEQVQLDAANGKLSVGRAEESDVRLYTASASREHAVIARNEADEWVLTPVAGKTVLVDGEMMTEPVVLEVGLNIILGQDHLRCMAGALATGSMSTQGAVDLPGSSIDPISTERPWSSRRSRIGWWVMGVVVALGVGLLMLATWLR